MVPNVYKFQCVKEKSNTFFVINYENIKVNWTINLTIPTEYEKKYETEFKTRIILYYSIKYLYSRVGWLSRWAWLFLFSRVSHKLLSVQVGTYNSFVVFNWDSHFSVFCCYKCGQSVRRRMFNRNQGNTILRL